MFTVTAWNNGGSGYGLRVAREDRARFFRRAWRTVTVALPNGRGVAAVNLTSTFWTTCPELRSASIGAWLRQNRMDTWPSGQPPTFTLLPTGRASFRLRR